MDIRSRWFTLAAVAALSVLVVAPAAAHIEAFTGTYVTEGSNGRSGSGALYMEYEEETNFLAISSSFAGLSGNTTVAHIHCCTALANTGNAGVALAGGPGGSLINFPIGVKAAAYNQSFNMGLNGVYGLAYFNANGANANQARDVLLDAFRSGRAYLNIHSSTFGGGEIRAWIAPIPEPGTWALMALGLLGVAGIVRHRDPR